ncbi:MAG TPA: TIGR01777 family oxidoreductase [Streptosporangiaceae bacterium]|nr:TIGR01777 family oxidoreductase [Streptosporangiaceae bacterium]
MRVAISAASGLIGSALAGDLSADGVEVIRLVRRAARAADEIGWDPQAADAGLDPAALAGVDAVVHLSGAPIAAGRWTAARKAELRSSRIASTATLVSAIAAADPAPGVLLCASAIGYYGDTGERTVDESSPGGTGFLAELVRDWEAAADPARAAGTRVATFRSGVVLAASGGMLGRLLLPFRLGLGAKVGSGRQYFSWISLTDEVRAIRFLLDSAGASGPFNLTAPEPVTNAEFTRALAKALGRQAVLGVPSAALRAALGEVASELLGSARVVPARLQEAGFRFAHPDIATALAALLHS